jgi:Domain of Unknown Function (DUF1080)
MQKTLFAIGLIAAMGAGSQLARTEKKVTKNISVNTLSNEEKKDGWQILFDGHSTKGWHRYGGGPAGSAWKIVDNALQLDTSNKVNGENKDGGDLTTDEDYDNFDLKLQWKISKGGNSGVIFYVYEDSVKYKKPYNTGLEMQVLDNDGHPDGKIIKHRAGDLYDLVSCKHETVKPVGEWNDAEIKSLHGKLDLYLNGENVVSTTLWDDNWKKLVAGSKFKDWQGFAAFKKGKISLQDHGNMVWFRDIKIKKL